VNPICSATAMKRLLNQLQPDRIDSVRRPGGRARVRRARDQIAQGVHGGLPAGSTTVVPVISVITAGPATQPRHSGPRGRGMGVSRSSPAMRTRAWPGGDEAEAAGGAAASRPGAAPTASAARPRPPAPWPGRQSETLMVAASKARRMAAGMAKATARAVSAPAYFTRAVRTTEISPAASPGRAGRRRRSARGRPFGRRARRPRPGRPRPSVHGSAASPPAHAVGRQDPGEGMDHHPLHAEGVGDQAGVLAAGAAGNRQGIGRHVVGHAGSTPA